MADILIHKPDDMPDINAMQYVYAVIKQGRISDYGNCYCYVSEFSDGTMVFASKRKADIFSIKRKDAVDG